MALLCLRHEPLHLRACVSCQPFLHSEWEEEWPASAKRRRGLDRGITSRVFATSMSVSVSLVPDIAAISAGDSHRSARPRPATRREAPSGGGTPEAAAVLMIHRMSSGSTRIAAGRMR